MEPILVVFLATLSLGLGVLATVLLALYLPADVHDRAREHGRFAHLADPADGDAEAGTQAAQHDDVPPRMSAYEGAGSSRPVLVRARARHRANALREALRHRRLKQN